MRARSCVSLPAVAFCLFACGGGGGGAPSLGISLQGPLTAGQTVTLTVRTPEGFSGAVTFESTDGRAVLPSRYTWTAADGTARGFDFQFRTAGAHTLTLRGTGLFSFETTVDVVAGPFATFNVELGSVQPGAGGAPFGMGARVTATDAWGNPVPHSAAADPVTITSLPADGSYGGLSGPGGNVLDKASDFQGASASLDGRFVFTWAGTVAEHRFVATSASGHSGTSNPVRIVTSVGVAGLARFLDINRSGSVDAGDHLIVPFERDVTVQAGSAQGFEFALPGYGLGIGAGVAQGPRPNEARIVLGSGASLRTRKLTAGPFPAQSSGVDLAPGGPHPGIRDVFGLPGGAGTPVDIVPGFVLSPQLIGSANTRAVACGDIDRDSDHDLVCANNGSASCIYRNDGRGNYVLVGSLTQVNAAHSVVLCDVDGDSDLDLVVTDIASMPRVLLNETSQPGHWLMVRAALPELGGRDAIGATVTVMAGEKRWMRFVAPGGSYLSSHDPRVHFGLGDVDQIDGVSIIWPDGSEERFAADDVDRLLTLRHGEGTKR